MSDPLSLPSPHEPFVDLQTGKVSEIWYRYLSQSLISANDATTVELTATSPLSISTANVVSITIPYAAQADEETGTSTTAIVTPGVQQFHPGSAKAWGYVTLAGTVATIQASYGVNATASTATGLLRVDLTTPFSSTAYTVSSVIADPDIVGFNKSVVISSSIGLGTTTFTLLAQLSDGTNAAAAAYHFVCYGDQ